MKLERISSIADDRSKTFCSIQPGRLVRLTGLAALLIATGGCSDPKAANETNFRKLLEPIVKDGFCYPITARRVAVTPQDPPFPIVIDAHPAGFIADASERASLEDGVRKGILRRTESILPAREGDSARDDVPITLWSYAPTEKGQPIFRAIGRKMPNGSIRPVAAACVATGTVTEIVRWTEPAAAFGRTLTELTYRYVGKDISDMATPEQRAFAKVPHEAKAMLVLASDGWQFTQ